MSPNLDETMMEVDIPIYAPSLPIPNVQEMVRTDPLLVPERYVRNQQDLPDSTNLSQLSSQIPIIDLSLLVRKQAFELEKLDLACKDWSFFQVVNHGVADEILQSISTSANEFFELPLEEKTKYAMDSNDIQGYGQAYVVSEEQKLDWSDILILLTLPSKYRNIKFWPTTPNNFKESIDAYSVELKRIAEELLCSISLNMGMNKDDLLEQHRELMQALRLNYYPACGRPDQVLGVSPHSDSSTITILLQSNSVNGLQIRHNGAWVPVQPIPNALIVNVGDHLEIWSNGRYKSIEHRAVTNVSRARISLAMFIFPHDDVEIEPFDVTAKKVYKKVKYGDYLRSTMNKKHDGKANIESAKIEA